MTDNLFVDPLPNQDMRVSTDKADYAPGETVKITAGGFAKDSTIQFEIKDDPNDPGDDGEADVYKPFSITDGGAGDLDGIANGQVLAAWGVPTDNNGTGSGTPDALNGTLILTATGSDGQMATTMFMDSGGSYSIKWYAADPAVDSGPYLPTYTKISPTSYLDAGFIYPIGSAALAITNPLYNAVAYASPPIPSNRDAVTSLAPKNMALGQIVPFEVEIDVLGSTAPENGAIEFTTDWLTKTTSGDNFGFDPNYKIIAAFVDKGDPLYVDTSGAGTNGLATVSSFTSTVVNLNTNNEQIQGTFKISGLDDGDKVIVEIWAVLKDMIPLGSTGNVQTGVVSAKTATGDTIETGSRTLPLLRVQEFFSANADLSVIKSDSTDASTNSANLTASPDVDPTNLKPGDTFTYTILAKNNSTDTVANTVVVTDTLDSNVTFVSASNSGVFADNGAAADTVTWSIGGLSPGESRLLTVTVQVKNTAPTVSPTQDLLNSVSITSITSDPNTDNNTNTEPTNLVAFNPNFIITKTAAIADGDAAVNAVGDVINYTISVENTGNQTLTGVTVTDNFATGLTRGIDTVGDNDDLLEVGEKWAYTATHTVTQAEIDAVVEIFNAATVDTAQTEPPKTASASVPVEQNPVIKVTKSNDGVADTNCDGKENAGDQIVYNYAVKNDGNVSLFNVTANDNQLGNITLTGLTDLDRDNTADDLAVGITATGTATATLTQAQIDGGSITNIALAKGEPLIGDPVTGTDTNTVNLTRTGDLKITKTDYLTKVVPGQCVTYTIVVSNCGPDTATHALVEDLFPSNLTDVKWTSKAAKGATDNKARGTDNIEDYVTLPAGSSITYKVTGTVVGGPGSHKVSDCHRTLTNTATVTAPSDFTDTNLENNTATDIDTIMAAPGVRNTHFWQNTKWQKSWDGIQGNEHSQKTRPNFPDSDLLLSPYTNSARSGKVLDPITRRYGVGLLIGDYNHNGKTDKKENTLFYTRAQALQIVDSSMHPNNRDTRYILGRDLVTSWLNYLAGNSIDTPNSKDQDARDYINEGIQWLQALTPDQNRDGKGDGYLQGLTGNETSNSRTPQILARSSYWKSGISSASNLPNSYKSNTDVLYPIDAGITIHTHLDNYNNNIF